MKVGIDYGSEHLDVDVRQGSLIVGKRKGSAGQLANVSNVVEQLLEEPEGFPPLRRALTPEDHVAIVVDDGLERPEELIAPIVDCLTRADVKRNSLTCLFPPKKHGVSLAPVLSTGLEDIAVEIHDPSDRHALSYLAMTKSDRRIYLNRTLVDADQVVVVNRVDYSNLLGYSDGLKTLFPELSDEETRAEFAALEADAVLGTNAPNAVRKEAEEVAWLLGMPFFIEVVPGNSGSVRHVVGGAAEPALHKAHRLLDREWQMTVKQPADLVVAGISGRQSFEDVAQALSSAAAAVRPGGRIVLLSDAKDVNAGPCLKRIRRAKTPVEGLRALQNGRQEDKACACRVAVAALHAQIYLLSEIPDTIIHELFATPLDCADDVQRLVSQAGSCLFIPEAHRTKVVLNNGA